MSSGIREAASVIVGRNGGSGLEVLVLERSAGSRFLPGYVAFPGGAIDDLDRDLAERWFGTPEESTRAGVLRELVEECGLGITAKGLVASTSLDPIHHDPPLRDDLPEIAHWVAPVEVPVRFDARYFAVAASVDVAPTPDAVETADAWWAAPSDLLDGWERQERKLYWPTLLTMRSLLECATAAELLTLRVHTREPDDEELEWLHRSTFYQD